MPAKRTGRRPGPTRTREAIGTAARRQFSALGYDRTTMRRVASEAGVDPALVVHFFGSKQRLFLEVVELPVDPADVVEQIAAGPRSEIGQRLAALLLGVFENPELRDRWVAMIRAAASDPEAAKVLRRLLETRLLTPLAEELGMEDARFRATLAGSQVVGLGMAKYVVGVEPIASASPEKLAAAIGPTLQRYLTGPLD
jgi:AcrR family transcriptional regulator